MSMVLLWVVCDLYLLETFEIKPFVVSIFHQIGIIGGTGMHEIKLFTVTEEKTVKTSFGAVSYIDCD